MASVPHFLFRPRLAALAFLLLTGFGALPAARAVPPASTPPPAAAVTGAAFDAAAATRAYLESVPAEKRAKSDVYFEGTYWLILWNYLLGAGISLLLLAAGLSARLRDFAERTTRFRPLQVMIYAAGYVLLTSLLRFPLTVYEGYFREHQYGMATQTFGPWFGEQLIGLGVGLLGTPIALAFLYGVFRVATKTWWVWGTAVSVGLMVFLLLLQPVFLDPLFNEYKPLTDASVRDPILTMAKANQIPVNDVMQFDASRQTKRVSANVAGFLGTTRIALNDNLLNQCSLPEIRMVMAHEMGHYVLNHIGKFLVTFGVILAGAFGLCAALFQGIVARWGAKWGVRGIADPAGFPLIILLFSTYFFLLTPVLKSTIRVAEREADAFGLNVSREPDGFAQVALKLGVYRKLDPGPLEEMFFFDHPSGRARIRMAMDWKAETQK